MTDQVKVFIDDKEFDAPKGEMIIRVTDQAGIYVPRFCYHDKLSIAANCRMCLVEIEGVGKPLPACATPITDGMKVYTQSAFALRAQRAVMEFLLINHPLDCPICDQGGECELQDLALAFGKGASRYTERKRAVEDQNLGPLVSTDMTRCIQCTRCVRFGDEIAGIQELGTIGRSDTMEISTYIEQSVDHELSGNIIDLCPVGALNSKPFRFKARGWEMTQHETVAPHDAIGSNIYAHVLRGKLLRVVARPNEEVNEVWISDRDRFSYEGIYSDDRLKTPMVKRDGQWVETGWEEALEVAADGIRSVIGETQQNTDQVAVLAAANATLEELYLTARLARGLGTNHIDHRLRQIDFRDQEEDPTFPYLGCEIAVVERLNALLVVGSRLRWEAPLLAHRVRKMALAGGDAMFVNPRRLTHLFPIAAEISGEGMDRELGGVLAAAAEITGAAVPDTLAKTAVEPTATHRDIARRLHEADDGLVLLGQLSMQHSGYANLRAIAAGIASLTGVRLGYLPPAANSAGATLVGVLPHRDAGGRAVDKPGANADQLLRDARRAYLLFGVEPEHDSAAGLDALDTLRAAEHVVAVTAYVTERMRAYANVLLPIGTFAETAGTFINCEGRVQSFNGATQPVGEARPGWKVLRVLGNWLGLSGFEYESIEDLRVEVFEKIGAIEGNNAFNGRRALEAASAAGAAPADVPIYATDALVRRSVPLQNTHNAGEAVS